MYSPSKIYGSAGKYTVLTKNIRSFVKNIRSFLNIYGPLLKIYGLFLIVSSYIDDLKYMVLRA